MANDNKPEIKDDVGDWVVEIHPDYPEYVHIQFTELDHNGILVHEVYMYAHTALNFAQAIKSNAQELIS